MPWHQVLARLTITPVLVGAAVAAVIATPQVLIHLISHSNPALTIAGTTITLGLTALVARTVWKDTQ